MLDRAAFSNPKFISFIVTLSLVTTACSSSQPTTEAPNPPIAASATWHEKMQALSKALSRLLPLVSSRAKFNDPKNGASVEEDTRQLRTLAHSLKTTGKPNSDPSLQMMTQVFADDLDRALEGLRGGNRDYARQILKDTTSYCIQCHTQTNNGPDFPRLALEINTNELSSLEQAEFFAATRQFTPALEAYERVLSDPTLAKTDPFAWEQAARSALAITVRVKADPKETAKLLSRIESHPTLPESTRRAIRAWKKAVRDWTSEGKTGPLVGLKAIKKGEDLITTAQKKQEFPLDHSEDIQYFRASSLMHDVLASEDRTPEVSAKALYLSGIASEATRDMNFWTLHETYFEQCVRTLPHSSQASTCFERLNDSVTLGYSGSSGTQIPADVRRRLSALKALAGPSTPAKTE